MPSTDPRLVRGRAARSNSSSRFNAHALEVFDDGWDDLTPLSVQVRTSLSPMKSKTVITRNTSPDVGFDRSINPYRGCEHGCIYCFARPAHAYLGLSPGQDFETQLYFKPNAGEMLKRELSRKSYKPAVVHLGADTDPYQPAERQLKITRSLLDILEQFGHPVSLISKSDLILRDLDILQRLGERGLIRVAISITTLDRTLARKMEPRAATPSKRLKAIEGLASAGIPVKVLFAPTIPGLNDQELEAVLSAAASVGATSAGYILLRLPREISTLFKEWLDAEVPDRASRIMSLVRQMRNGLEYDSHFGTRMFGKGPMAQLLSQRFDLARRRFGLDGPQHPPPLDLFSVPKAADNQGDLFSD
jgi:DNA repair photolyase